MAVPARRPLMHRKDRALRAWPFRHARAFEIL